MKRVKIIQIDGALPNLALMRLSAWHKSQGDSVYFSRRISPELDEPNYDVVYASAIFTSSVEKIDRFKKQYPHGIIGGTGYDLLNLHLPMSNLSHLQIPDSFTDIDYGIYPNFTASIGFSQRGCRLKCAFCVVPKKEGGNEHHLSIGNIYRGKPHPRHLHLLDNDFFGQPDWKEKCKAIIDGNFKVCFSQGINIRLFNEEQAQWLKKINYRCSKFESKRIYTAWDNLGQKDIFFKGVKILNDAGIISSNIMAYMLVGYKPNETEEEVLERFYALTDAKIMPYPMVYDNPEETDQTTQRHRANMKKLQRWAIRREYKKKSFSQYKAIRDKIAQGTPLFDGETQ